MSQSSSSQDSLAETAGDREQALLDFAVSHSPAIFYLADLDGDRPIRFISSNVESITGHKPDAFLAEARYGRGFIHPDDLAGYDATLKRLKAAGGLTHEYRFRTLAGDYLWFRDELRLTPRGAGGRAEFVGCMIDITAEKHAEAQLREAEAINAAIINAAQDAIVTMDDEGRFIDLNPAAERMFGYRREDAIGRPVADLIIPPAHRDAHARGLRRFRDTGESDVANSRLETEAQRADGSVFPVEIMIARAKLGEGSAFIGEVRDMTDRVRAEAERQRLAQLLHDAVESLSAGFSITDADDRVVLCNRSFAAAYGRDPEAMVGRRREDNVREFYGLMRRFDGVPMSGTGAEIPLIVERLRRVDVEPVEIEMKSGEWMLVSSVATSDGGTVTMRTDITRQKKAEEALRESEALIRRVLEACPAPIAMIRVGDGRIIYESPALQQLFKRDPVLTDVSAQDYYADPSDRSRYLSQLRRDGRVDDYEVFLKKFDGTQFWAAVSARLIEYQGEEVVVAVTTDLTERKQREADLRHARETLEDAIESLSEGFALFDAEDRLVTCNERYRESHTACADVLKPGVKWIDLARAGAERGQYADAVGRVQEWLESWAAGRVKLPASREFQQTDGRWFVSSSQRTRHGGIVVTRSEITRRKEMERALRKSEALIRRVLEACPVPVGMTRVEDGRILYESPASKALFGRDPGKGEVSTRNYFVNPEDRDRYVAQLQAHGAVDGFEVQFRKSNGEEFWASLSARLIDYQGENVIVSSTLDLTERREVEAEMARQRDALHQSEKLSALGALLAGVAHELNNPLSVVVGQALMLKETAGDQRIADRAAKIGNAADRCARIVKTFLAMARQQPAESTAVNMNEVIEAALEVTGYSLRSRDIDVSLRLARNLPPVWADSDQLNQVVTNLIVNAQHALQDVNGPRKLRITSRYRKQTREVIVKVKDGGRGIPDEIRRRIFEPFFTTKEVGTGTGIGLAVCHRIIESHGGKIRVDSAPGQGTAFVIRLPAAEIAEDAAPERAAEAAAGDAVSVLVVDDEADVAEIVADILRGDGHRVEIVESGRAALASIARDDFDIILSDLRMPGLDGPSLYQVLEERRPELVRRLAFITGDTMSARVKSFLDSVDRPYIEKPISPGDVREIVARMVGGSCPDAPGRP